MAVVDAGAAARKFDQLITTSHDDVLSLTPYADPTVLEPDADTLSVDMVIALLEPFAPKLKTRPANKKCVKGFVSVVRGCAFPEEFSLQKLADIWKNGCTPEALAALPQCIRPVGLTSQDTMQIIAVEEADGLYTILLHFLLNEPLTKGEVTGMSPGDLLTVPFRPDTWGAKKAFQRMLQSTQGWRLLFAKVGARADKDDSVSYTKVSLLKLQLSGPFHAGPISAILPKSVPHTFHSQAEKVGEGLVRIVKSQLRLGWSISCGTDFGNFAEVGPAHISQPNREGWERACQDCQMPAPIGGSVLQQSQPLHFSLHSQGCFFIFNEHKA